MKPEAQFVLAVIASIVVTILMLDWLYGIYKNTKSLCLSNLSCYQLYKDGLILKANGGDPTAKFNEALTVSEFELILPASKHLEKQIYQLRVHLREKLGMPPK